MLAAQTGFCIQDAKKLGNIKQRRSRRSQIPAGPRLRLHMPSVTLTAGWLGSLHAHAPTDLNTHLHMQTPRQTLTRSTRFTGDKPARVILAYFSAWSELQQGLHTPPPLLQREWRRCRRGGLRTRAMEGRFGKRWKDAGRWKERQERDDGSHGNDRNKEEQDKELDEEQRRPLETRFTPSLQPNEKEAGLLATLFQISTLHYCHFLVVGVPAAYSPINRVKRGICKLLHHTQAPQPYLHALLHTKQNHRVYLYACRIYSVCKYTHRWSIK